MAGSTPGSPPTGPGTPPGPGKKKLGKKNLSPALLGVLALLTGVAVIVAFVLVLVLAPGGDETPDATRPTGDAEPPPSSVPTEPPADCPPSTTVTTAAELQDALTAATPGDVIFLAPGTYQGTFTATAQGTKSEPIMLCGTADSVLDGGAIDGGYVFHLDGASYWTLQGFSVRNGQKGVMADETVGSVIRGLTVSEIGDEGIHLRRFSTDNLVADNHIRDTGLRKPKFGEGIYIGTAESNWCDVSDCQPDRSDRNQISGNDIADTTSENVDIKEGTTGGVLSNNTLDGAAITAADSWVDVKGNNWIIDGNTGTNAPQDGFQTHEILDGWGTWNVFRNNTADVNGPGYGYALAPERDNIVECNNSASDAEEGRSNVECTGS
ncbi:hypothetical protein D6T64_10830 [Cryobacterium melibiosiphilum]|uniref:Right handed beta helix domain-containing protein n=2 Tax=Cryobacterium melibiosiphilum TaxID=995039 RepID=A0A3A5MQP1_9MICO|nr:hypothetical protein D6T64_10830 [Cryobacterium melibiosiphilum]